MLLLEEEEGEVIKVIGLLISYLVVKFIIMFFVFWKILYNIFELVICILFVFFKKVIEFLVKIF